MIFLKSSDKCLTDNALHALNAISKIFTAVVETVTRVTEITVTRPLQVYVYFRKLDKGYPKKV